MRLSSHPQWTRHFVYRSERLRTTWKLRIGLVAFVAGAAWLTSGWWTPALARSLACERDRAPSDAIVIENFDMDNYLLFERAGELRRAGLAPRVIVPVVTDARTRQLNTVSLGTANLLATVARTGTFDAVPIDEIEPISLNAARDVLRFLKRERIRSVIVVSPHIRSRRTKLVYDATVERAGIYVTCEPVQASPGAPAWTDTWHGIENVVEQWMKLQYYRLYVLPVHTDS